MMSDTTTKRSEATTADRHDKTDVAELKPAPEQAQPLIEAELLVEDVSIDGMCGVY